jgi:hypothetical protein
MSSIQTLQKLFNTLSPSVSEGLKDKMQNKDCSIVEYIQEHFDDDYEDECFDLLTEFIYLKDNDAIGSQCQILEEAFRTCEAKDHEKKEVHEIFSRIYEFLKVADDETVYYLNIKDLETLEKAFSRHLPYKAVYIVYINNVLVNKMGIISEQTD